MSLRAAAREAGIVKARDPYRELQRWWDRASDADRSRFLDFLEGELHEREQGDVA